MLGKPIDLAVREQFIAALTPEYFSRLSEFLSIPLLATLMLMTYSDFAHVPQKMYIFYEQAFQTLFYKHDAIKGAFSRTIEFRSRY